jgi:hypothetical protein
MIKNYNPQFNSAYVDCFYDFKGQWEVPSRCGIKIKRTPEMDLVIATELYLENPGTSVTEFCAKLATLIVENHELDPQKLCFIVRTPENHSKLSFLNEFFALAHMEWNGTQYGRPQWEPVSKEKVDALLNT